MNWEQFSQTEISVIGISNLLKDNVWLLIGAYVVLCVIGAYGFIKRDNAEQRKITISEGRSPRAWDAADIFFNLLIVIISSFWYPILAIYHVSNDTNYFGIGWILGKLLHGFNAITNLEGK